ncbi:MAG: alpha/beta hydrolase [Verrucomicrobia bacterium]|nr:alpha/beta hydrolase [Verrucomicrobiota bacterium]
MIAKLKHSTPHRLTYAAATLLAVLGLGSCTVINGGLSSLTHKPWRMESPMIRVTDQEDAKGNETGNKQIAQLGIVEFDDQGQLWRDNYQCRNATTPGRSQLKVVLEALQERAKKGPVQLIIFAHGWNNNSSDLNQGNLRSFRTVLKSVAGTHPNPFGVFLSWRGKAMSFATGVDIYNREASAVKIGQAEATAAIQALCSAAKYKQPESRVLAVGHSLGAVIMLRALAQPLASQIAQASIDKSAARKMSPMVDTVVMVNAADTAVLASQMVRVMQDYQVKFKRGGRDAPLLVSFTSEGDWATGWVYSTATMIGRYLLGSFMTSNAGATSSRVQEHATVTSVGWHGAIRSHTLKEPGVDAPRLPVSDEVRTGKQQALSKPEQLSLRAKYLMSQNFKPAQPGQKNLVVWLDPTLKYGEPSTGPLIAHDLVHQDHHSNDTPYWIFQVPKYVVRDHTDVWNSNFVGLVTAIHNASREPKPKGTVATPLPRAPKELPPIQMGIMSASPRL